MNYHTGQPESPPLALPELVRAEPVGRSHSLTSLSKKDRQQDLDSSFSVSTGPILDQPDIHEWLLSLELHLYAPMSSAKTVDYFLKEVLLDLEGDILEEGQARNVARWVLVVMKKYRFDIAMQSRCLRLMNLFPSAELAPNESVKQTLAAMRNHPKCEQIQCWGCQVLEGLLTCVGYQIFTTFNTEGGMECVLAAARTFKKVQPTGNRILYYIRAIAKHYAQQIPNKTIQHEEWSLDRLHAGLVALRLSAREQ
jgi:hypothetical protein